MSHWSALLQKNLGPEHDDTASTIKPLEAKPALVVEHLNDEEFFVPRRARIPLRAWNEEASESSKPKATPLGDFRVRSAARERHFQSLLGDSLPQPRRELVNDEILPSHVPQTQLQAQRKERKTAAEKARLAAAQALKRDAAAEKDEDGYVGVKETPTFRDGLNPTLRVLPPAASTVRGLKLDETTPVPTLIAAGVEAYSARSADVTHRRPEKPAHVQASKVLQTVERQSRSAIEVRQTSSRSKIAKFVGAYFVRGISDPIGNSLREEQLDSTRRRPDELISTAVGNAFVNLGMTQAAGRRDDPMKNDSIALQIGSRIMESTHFQNADAPEFESTEFRREVALALGRAVIHLQTAGAVAGRGAAPNTTTKSLTDSRVNQRSHAGQLALSFVDAAAARIGKEFQEDPRRREMLSRVISGAIESVGAGTRNNEKPVIRALANNPSLNKRFMVSGHDAAPPSVPRNSGTIDRRGEKGQIKPPTRE